MGVQRKTVNSFARLRTAASAGVLGEVLVSMVSYLSEKYAIILSLFVLMGKYRIVYAGVSPALCCTAFVEKEKEAGIQTPAFHCAAGSVVPGLDKKRML